MSDSDEVLAVDNTGSRPPTPESEEVLAVDNTGSRPPTPESEEVLAVDNTGSRLPTPESEEVLAVDNTGSRLPTPESEEADDQPLPRWFKIGLVLFLVAIVGGACTVCSICTGPSKEEKAIRDAERKRTGQHCKFEAEFELGGQIRAQMLDPSSYEGINAAISPVDASGYHVIELRFRGLNRSGLVGISTATGIVNNETCDATLLTIE